MKYLYQKLDIRTFRVPGAAPCTVENVVEVPGTLGYQDVTQACVAAADQDLSLREDEDDDDPVTYTKF